MSIPPQLWSFTERHQRIFKTKECLAARGHSQCGGRIVRAHIISRSQLRQIARRGRVIAVPTSLLAIMRMQRTKFEAKEIGIGEFSTMNCFCADHDKKLFAPIEDAPLAFSSEQLALLHYRAVAAEFYQRNSQQESAASELDWESDEPQNFRFEWIFTWSSKAFHEAHHALIRTRKLIAARRFTDIRSLVVRFDAPPSVIAAGAFRHSTISRQDVSRTSTTNVATWQCICLPLKARRFWRSLGCEVTPLRNGSSAPSLLGLKSRWHRSLSNAPSSTSNTPACPIHGGAT
jgi:hypothetical protein